MKIIGKGTCLVKCRFCGKSMLDGELVKHWLLEDCIKKQKEGDYFNKGVFVKDEN